ncbi:MAG: helix-turn-helix transcriptional regulator [Clostridia bacterium]|nr:helix-turn-helix transcriptional regulator [Clostridia bacterium]
MKQTKTALNVAVGANLKLAIKRSKWKTQERFSEAFGAAGRTVGRWCNGGIDSFMLAQQLADFLGIDVFALLSP